jgi:hypothetical protein
MLLPLAKPGSANTERWYGVGDPTQSAGGKGKMHYEISCAYARRAASKELYTAVEKPGPSSYIGHSHPTTASASGTRTGSTIRTSVAVTRSDFVMFKSTSISEESSVSRGPPR